MSPERYFPDTPESTTFSPLTLGGIKLKKPYI